MCLDHVSNVTLHDQLVDIVQYLHSTFADGGVHLRFGTPNFTLALQNGHYIKIVCPLDHPRSDGVAVAAIEKITITDNNQLFDSWFASEILDGLSGADIEFISPS